MSTIASINIKMGGHLTLTSKITLALSISCQLAAKLTIMLFIAMTAVPPDLRTKSLSTTSAVLLLVLSILIGWALNLLLHAHLNTDFHMLSLKEKIIHLLATTWFTLPVRRMEDRNQRHKRRELFFGLIISGLNLLGTFVATNVLMPFDSDWGIGDWLPLGLFFIMLHLAGCGFLFLFEAKVQPWRQPNKKKESHCCCWGKLLGTDEEIVAEPTVWDKVRLSINSSFDYLATF